MSFVLTLGNVPRRKRPFALDDIQVKVRLLNP
jgi:hypothetical protein